MWPRPICRFFLYLPNSGIFDPMSKPLGKDWVRPLKNAGIVGIGKGAQGLVSLIALALAARHLGVETFGFFVLIHGMVFGCSQIIRFQTWQAVLKYGADALEHRDYKRLSRLIRFTFTLDVSSAVVGTGIMVGLAGPLARSFSLPADQIWLTQVYSLSIALMLLTPTQLGVLRLFNRFDLVAIQTVIAPFLRFFGTIILFFLVPEAGLIHYLAVWLLGTIVARQSMFIFARNVLREHGYAGWRFTPKNLLKPPEKGIWTFITGHNIFRSLYVSREEIGLLMVGWLLGPAAAGIFKIAQKFAGVMIKPVEKFLVPALYPELARFAAGADTLSRRKGRRKMITANLAVVGVVAASLFLVLIFTGKWLIASFSGEAYTAAYTPMILLCTAGFVTVISYPLEPFLSAAGKIREIIVAYGAGLVIYIGALYVLTLKYNLTGTALAALAASSAGALFLFASRPRS